MADQCSEFYPGPGTHGESGSIGLKNMAGGRELLILRM